MAKGAILITGASRGLGAALAEAYAAPAQRLILTARSLEALTDCADICRKKGADVTLLALDLEDPDSVADFHSARGTLDPEQRDLTLVIANAGIFSGRTTPQTQETVEAQILQINVNLTANIALLAPIAEEMRQRRSGHIAVVSSLAAHQPQPDSAAYSASKAGLSAWAKAMADDLIDDGVLVTTIAPGHIKTAQTETHQGLLPGLISAEQAAGIIQRGLARAKRTIVFPRSIALLIWLSDLLPDALRRFTLKSYRYTVGQSPSQPQPSANLDRKAQSDGA